MPWSTNTFGAIHTNIIEGFWSIYKPGVVGTRQGQRQNICRSTSRRSLTNARPTWAASKRRKQPEEIGSDRIRIGLACNASARLVRRRSVTLTTQLAVMIQRRADQCRGDGMRLERCGGVYTE